MVRVGLEDRLPFFRRIPHRCILIFLSLLFALVVVLIVIRRAFVAIFAATIVLPASATTALELSGNLPPSVDTPLHGATLGSLFPIAVQADGSNASTSTALSATSLSGSRIWNFTASAPASRASFANRLADGKPSCVGPAS